MKKALLLLPFLVVGCHVETDAPAVTPSATKPSTTSTEPTTPPEKEPTKPQTTSKALRHPDRVYQLSDLAIQKLSVKGKTIDAWVMDDDGKRMEGMMFLKTGDVREDQGMIFVFPGPQDENHGFWMQNTYVPLDIVYISPEKKVVSVGKGQPLNESSIYPKGKYQYVLELKQGTAAQIGLKPGDSIALPSNLKTDS